MAWQHPTGNAPKVVHLVGLGPTHHDYDQGWLNPATPEVLWQANEVWAINRGCFNIRHDMLWVMDHISGEAENFPVYGAKLWNHDKPIITSDNADGWPPHVHLFPFDEIWTWLNSPVFKTPPKHMLFHNSVAFVVVYAAFIGVKQIRGWGLDYHHHKSGRVEDGHANVAYWVGRMEEAGLEVAPVESSTFLGVNMSGYIYGYQRDPRPPAVAKRAQFARIAGIDPGETIEDGPARPAEAEGGAIVPISSQRKGRAKKRARG